MDHIRKRVANCFRRMDEWINGWIYYVTNYVTSLHRIIINAITVGIRTWTGDNSCGKRDWVPQYFFVWAIRWRARKTASGDSNLLGNGRQPTFDFVCRKNTSSSDHQIIIIIIMKLLKRALEWREESSFLSGDCNAWSRVDWEVSFTCGRQGRQGFHFLKGMEWNMEWIRIE